MSLSPLRRIIYGICVLGREHFRRNLVADRLEDFQFLSFRQALCAQGDAVVERIDALVLPEEDRPVEFLEIEGKIESPADARVLKERTAEVWHEADHHARDLFQLD
jgi:hypothetical protein